MMPGFCYHFYSCPTEKRQLTATAAVYLPLLWSPYNIGSWWRTCYISYNSSRKNLSTVFGSQGPAIHLALVTLQNRWMDCWIDRSEGGWSKRLDAVVSYWGTGYIRIKCYTGNFYLMLSNFVSHFLSYTNTSVKWNAVVWQRKFFFFFFSQQPCDILEIKWNADDNSIESGTRVVLRDWFLSDLLNWRKTRNRVVCLLAYVQTQWSKQNNGLLYSTRRVRPAGKPIISVQ